MPLRIVLITGANSGVGLASTKMLVSASKDYLVIIASRSLVKAQNAKEEVAAEVPGSESRLFALQLDVTDGDSIIKARDVVEREFGHIDALINNAAVGSQDPDIYTRYKTVMDTNVVGPAVVTDVFRPLLLKSSNPYSIFVSSGAGSFSRGIQRHESKGPKTPEPKNGGAYYVSKAALNMLALREHFEFGEKGLKLITMSPGFVISNLRGTTEELRSGWGQARPASESGEFMLDILEGKRDADVGKVIWKDGVYDW